jgi:type II secretory pathway component PulJ
MKLLHLHRKKIFGFGLFEILISLAIFAVGVISITSLNVKTYRVIKNNELMDFADRTMVKALEYFKSPTTNDLQNMIELEMNAQGNTTKSINYSIDSNSLVDDGTVLNFVKRSYDATSLISTCTNGSLYKLSTSPDSLYSGFDICEQIIIEKKVNGYKITSRVVYSIDTGTKINQLIGYRPFTYAENN